MIFEIILDFLMLALGLFLAIKAGDNHLKKVWAIVTALCAVLMLWDNISLLYRPRTNAEQFQLLVIPRMLKWYLFAQAFSFFPLASLRPDWLTVRRIFLYTLPFVVVSLAGLCYQWFGRITPLYSIQDIFYNFGNTDVKVRLGVFLASVVMPVFYFALPFVGRWFVARRRLTGGMYLYAATALCLMWLYILFTLDTTDWLFDIYGYAIIFLPVLFSLLYFRSENPFSTPVPVNDHFFESGKIGASQEVCDLSHKMTQWVDSEMPFVSADYTLDRLVRDLNADPALVGRAIRNNGFTCFKEYIGFLRVEYFKKLALATPFALPAELMSRCGFTSYADFSRLFCEQERMSPEKYLDLLSKGEID